MKKDSQAEHERGQFGGSDPRIKELFSELDSPRLIGILIVSSSKAHCEWFQRAMEALRHRVVSAASTEQALKIFYSTAFNLVVCDRGPDDSACAEFAACLKILIPRQRVLVLDFAATLRSNQFMPDGVADEIAK